MFGESILATEEHTMPQTGTELPIFLALETPPVPAGTSSAASRVKFVNLATDELTVW